MSTGDKYTAVFQLLSFRYPPFLYLRESSLTNRPVTNRPLCPVKHVSPVIFKFMYSFRLTHFSYGPVKCTSAFSVNISEFCCQYRSKEYHDSSTHELLDLVHCFSDIIENKGFVSYKEGGAANYDTKTSTYWPCRSHFSKSRRNVCGPLIASHQRKCQRVRIVAGT